MLLDAQLPNWGPPTIVAVVALTFNSAVQLLTAGKRHGSNDANLATLMQWKKAHEIESEHHSEQMSMLREIAATQRQINVDTDRRLGFLEEEYQDRIKALRKEGRL